MNGSARRTVAHNTVYNAMGRLWEGAVGLVLVPYIVWRVGMDGWGLWAVVSVFTGYASLVDLGIGSGFAKFIAEHAARDEDEEISSVVSTGLLFYLGLGVVLVSVGWVAIPVCMGLFVEGMAWMMPERGDALRESAMLEEATFLFQWGLVLLAISNCVAPLSAIQTGLQRMGITNVVSVGASIVKLGATVMFLEWGFGVRGLLFANAIVLGVFSVATFGIAFVICPGLHLSPARVRRDTFQKLFHFGWRTQVSRLSNVIMFNTDTLIVGLAFAQLRLVGVYRIGEELASKMRQLPALMLSALVPAASALDAQEKHGQVRRLYLLSTKYTASMTFPLVALTAGGAGMLMRTWMGPDHETSVWVLRILAVGYLGNILPGAGVSVALGKGRADLQMKAGIIATVSNVLLTIGLVLTVGFWGIPIATALSTFLSWFWFVRAMGGVVDVRAGELFRVSMLWPLVACLPGLALSVVCDVLTVDVAGRVGNGVVLALCTFCLALSYLFIVRLTPLFDAYDLEFFESTLSLDRVPGYGLWRRSIGRA